MKKEIENEYINAIYNDLAPNVFADKILSLFGKEEKETRTGLQNRARWKYLDMVSKILNSEGQTFTPQGTDIQIKWNKDLLYEIYWQYMRKSMYPNKKCQLNTKEFSDLVEMVQALFAQIFGISISFPNIQNLIKRDEEY